MGLRTTQFGLGLLLLSLACTPSAKVEHYAQRIASLIDPVKLKTLSDRGANPRVQKYVYWLAMAKLDGTDSARVAARAVALAGYEGQAGKLTTEVMVRNLNIAERLGCLNAQGLDDMRRGQSPSIQNGPYRGDELSVDHIIPLAVCYELHNTIANLELMPLRMNVAKREKIGDRQLDVANKLHSVGLLSDAGWKTIQRYR